MLACLPAFALACCAAQTSQGAGLVQQLADGQTVPVDGVLVLLNDQIITESQIALDATRMMRGQPGLDPDTAFGRALTNRLSEILAREGFARLGLDMSLLEGQVSDRLAAMIEESGSRARFEQGIQASGYDMASFRAAMEGELVHLTWRSIVVGDQPSPLEGYRNQVSISPAEIRAEYDANPGRWKQEESLVWATLQFFDDANGPGAARAAQVTEQLRKREITPDQAAKLANSTKREQGDPSRKSLRDDIQEFLQGAAPSDVSPVDLIPNLGAQVVVLLEKNSAREISFAEAQPVISQELRNRKRALLMNEEIGRIVRSSYFWYAPQLKAFMASVPGVDGNESQEIEF